MQDHTRTTQDSARQYEHNAIRGKTRHENTRRDEAKQNHIRQDNPSATQTQNNTITKQFNTMNGTTIQDRARQAKTRQYNMTRHQYQ